MSDLPKPRKRPKQARSQALVKAITQACLQILHSESDEALTMERLSEVSGVAIGSIYQYFSTKEGVIAAVYKEVLREEGKKLHALGETVKPLTIEAALREVFRHAIQVELRLNQLSRDFHRKYYRELSLLEQYRKTYADSLPGEQVWLEFIHYFQPSLPESERTMAANILARGFRAMIGEMIEHHPDLVDSETFLDRLVNMGLICLQSQPQTNG